VSNEVFLAIQSACFELGLTPPPADLVVFDGKIHRFHDPAHDKRGEQNGWVKSCDNGNGSFGGTIGHWRLGCKKNWASSSRRAFTPEEKVAYAKQMQEARKREAEQRDRQYQLIAQKAESLWARTQPADWQHPYLLRKGIGRHNLRQVAKQLVVPLRDADRRLWSLQYIGPDGGKRFLSGGRTAGCYWSIGRTPVDILLVAEGFATAATLYEATGLPVVAAMNAGNLLAVSADLSKKYPKVRLLLCADADPVGRERAQAAADAVGGIVIEPDFEGVPYGESTL